MPAVTESEARDGAAPSPISTLIVFTTLPDEAGAVKLAEALLQHRLAACVHRLPAGVSMYRWNGTLTTAPEFTLIIKTTAARWVELRDAICALHPYDTPELLAITASAGLPEYLTWIVDETR